MRPAAFEFRDLALQTWRNSWYSVRDVGTVPSLDVDAAAVVVDDDLGLSFAVFVDVARSKAAMISVSSI
ncbi:hypothetical protein [Absidia glauca]|uniref:Uncharacterized protein n=1 Tax=Absidia glauca TaxID=4829 RepID=A0A168NR36_ABSGL|nr:hypothetical protein [Absidia glauca]